MNRRFKFEDEAKKEKKDERKEQISGPGDGQMRRMEGRKEWKLSYNFSMLFYFNNPSWI